MYFTNGKTIVTGAWPLTDHLHSITILTQEIQSNWFDDFEMMLHNFIIRWVCNDNLDLATCSMCILSTFFIVLHRKTPGRSSNFLPHSSACPFQLCIRAQWRGKYGSHRSLKSAGSSFSFFCLFRNNYWVIYHVWSKPRADMISLWGYRYIYIFFPPDWLWNSSYTWFA